MLHVEDRQLVVVHLFSGMLGHDVLTVSDLFSNSSQDSLEHSRVTFRPPNGYTLNREQRENQPTKNRNRCAPHVGCSVVLGGA